MKTYVLIVILLFNLSTVFAQQKAKKLVAIPLRADLSAYVPPVQDQGKAPTTVAWATAYYAYTTQLAAQQNITDSAQLKQIALSPLLPYQRLRPACERGLDLPDIGQDIVKNGDVSYADYPAIECNTPPTVELLAKAKTNRPIKEVIRLFDETNTNAEKIFLTKEQIGRFRVPVIIGMRVTQKLINLTAADDYYQPEGEATGLHAVTVVGYDQTGFLLVNSWGKQWGKKGFFRMRYADFAREAVSGIVLILPDQPGVPSK